MKTRRYLVIATALVLSLTTVAIAFPGGKADSSGAIEIAAPTGHAKSNGKAAPCVQAGTEAPAALEAMHPTSAGYVARWGKPVFKKPSRFKVKASQPIDVVAAEGTRLLFPAKAFVHKDGRPVRGEVEIAVQEYYSYADFLKAQLHTLSDQGLLSSGGTVHVAATADGEQLELAPGTSYDIGFATDEMLTGMFAWQIDTLELVWKKAGDPATTGLAWDPKIYYEATRGYQLDGARFMGGDQGFEDFINLRQQYPEDAAKLGIKGTAVLRMVIGKDGRVRRVDPVSYDFPSFAYEGVRLLRSATFAPAIDCESKGMEEERTITLHFPNPYHGDFRYTDAFRQQFDKDYAAFEQKPHRTAEVWQALIDKTEHAIRRMRSRLEAPMDTVPDPVLPRTIIVTRRIMVNSSGLGWTNCDQLFSGSGARINQYVKLANEEQGASFYALIFDGVASVVMEDGFYWQGAPREKACFHSAVAGEQALLVRLHVTDDGRKLVAYQRITTGDEADAPEHLMPIAEAGALLGGILGPKDKASFQP